jgi:hypothetical protein
MKGIETVKTHRTKQVAGAPSVPKTESQHGRDAIAERAYETFLAHGGTPGAVYKAMGGDWGVEFPRRVE